MLDIIKYNGQTAEELFGKREELTSNVENIVDDSSNNTNINPSENLD